MYNILLPLHSKSLACTWRSCR